MESWRPVKLAAGVCAVGAVYVLMTAGDLLAFILNAPSGTGMSGTWQPTKLGVLTVLYVTTAVLLGSGAWQILRPSSPQCALVAGWSPLAMFLWAGGIAYLLLVYYPLPYYDHHADKLFLVLGFLVSWCAWLVLHPQGLKHVLESRLFQWLRVVLFNLLVFLMIGEATSHLVDPLLARSSLFSTTGATPAGLAPYRTVDGSIKHTNSQGFRDRERTIERTSSAPRIIALGDSFVWGAGVSYDETFVTLLENALQSTYSGAEVINLGVSGFQPDEYLSLLKWHGIRFLPDLVLLNLYVGNDLLQSEGAEMIVAGQRYKVHINGNWVHDHLAWDHWYLFHNLNYAYRVGTARMRHLMGMPELGFWDTSPGVAQTRHGKPVFSGWNRSYLRIIQSRGDQFLKEDTPLFEYRWNRTRETLEKINQLLRSRGIPWIMVLLPAEEQVDQELQRVYLETIDAPSERYDFEKPQRLLRAWGHANGVPIVDLTPVFRSEAPHGRLYRANDFHWNEAGHALAAASLLPVLRNVLGPNETGVARLP